MAASSQGGGGGLFVRQSTGLVREASALDATIFNAVFSAPVGATLAFGLFWALSAFPQADFVVVTLISFLINIPILIMMSLLASSMPRTGGDYVWVSRILSPPVALVSNFGAALSAMIGATFWARYFAVLALGPVLTSLGAMLGIQVLTDWGTAFQTDKIWTFLGGFSMIALMTVILIRGTKTTFRWQNAFWLIASTGTFVAFVCFALGGTADFEQHFNTLNQAQGGGTMQDVIAAAGVAGLQPDLGKLDMTLPAIFVVMTFMMWNWWSVYLSGELKSAMNRRRQMTIMIGALAWDVLFIALGAALLFKVTGFDFVVAANSGTDQYAIPGGAFYQVLAALVPQIPALTVLIVGSFLFWSLPAMVGNTFMPIRTVFAWSFDRLLPERFSEVNERTHSPVPAILLVMGIVSVMLAWSVWSTDFNTWLALGVLAGVVCIVIVAVAAMVFPTRRADLYQASPANVKVAGIPVLYIVAPLAILAMAFLVWCVLAYPPLALGSPDNAWWVPTFIGGIVVFGLAVYFGAKIIRRGQGIDIDLVYRELPPE
ncbi:MAG: APC family permease [Candidatus Limnocylindrales bacterium]